VLCWAHALNIGTRAGLLNPGGKPSMAPISVPIFLSYCGAGASVAAPSGAAHILSQPAHEVRKTRLCLVLRPSRWASMISLMATPIGWQGRQPSGSRPAVSKRRAPLAP
jgi:hypothetical protein